MENENEKKSEKVVSIVLYAEDQEHVDRIKAEYGLIKSTDCLRVALRLALRQIESQQSVAA